MKYLIDKSTGKPAYLQLYLQIRRDIIDSIYPPKSKLPSKRLIAEECGISTITVEHAYALLCEEGYAEARQRSGYYVIFQPNDGFASASERQVAPVHQPDRHHDVRVEFPFSVLSKTMRSVISGYGDRILERSPNSGCIELRCAIQKYLARSRGIYSEPDQIIIGSGSEYLYSVIVELLGRDKCYAIESPSYKRIEEVYRATGLEPVKLPLEIDGIDSAALRACSADVLHISPYRSYPSGVTASASKRHEYLSWATDNRSMIIEDDFESEFSVLRKPEDTLFSQSSGDNVIYMNTFSKTVSSSLRVGYMVLPKHLVPLFQNKLGFYSCTVPTYIQFVLAELIESGDFERHINRVRRTKRKEQQIK